MNDLNIVEEDFLPTVWVANRLSWAVWNEGGI